MSKQQGITNQLIDGAVGKLELRVDAADADGSELPVAVICHPHPVHGGTMDNKVVYCLARELADLGLVVARFNFRGVGVSEGSYDQGRGERDDLLAVVEHMRNQFPGRPLWLAGFSFGGYIAASASQQCAAQHLILVAPAITRDYFDVEVSVEVPGVLIHGSDDQLIDPVDAKVWANRQAGQVDYEQIEGGDHFFHGKLNELRQLINASAQSWLTAE